VLRYQFGFRGDQLTMNAVGPRCGRCDAGSIGAYLDSLGTALDVDGNGAADPLTDGLLVVRYLFGVRGDQLVIDAVGAGCKRCSPDQIQSYLAGMTNQ